MNTPQKYPTGTRVHIASDLGPSMAHFHKDKNATVLYTYAQQYGGNNYEQYALDVDGVGFIAWYHEHQLSPIVDQFAFAE